MNLQWQFQFRYNTAEFILSFLLSISSFSITEKSGSYCPQYTYSINLLYVSHLPTPLGCTWPPALKLPSNELPLLAVAGLLLLFHSNSAFASAVTTSHCQAASICILSCFVNSEVGTYISCFLCYFSLVCKLSALSRREVSDSYGSLVTCCSYLLIMLLVLRGDTGREKQPREDYM